MPDIEFTQYMLPDGRNRPVRVNVPQPVFEKAQDIIASGHRFECEMLNDMKTISVTIHNIEDEEDVAIEVVPNGPGVTEAIDRMIMDFAGANAA